MEQRQVYRWNKRRAVKLGWASWVDFDIFDFSVLALIFTLWLLILKFSFFYANTSLVCAESFANFGRTTPQSMSVFEIGVLLSFLLGLFWTIIALARFKDWPSIGAWALWHGTIFASIALLWAGCFSLTSKHTYPMPDGVLKTVPFIEATHNGETIYEPYKDYNPKMGTWEFGSGDRFISEKCVWLDDGRVNDNHMYRMEDYEAYLQNDYMLPRLQKPHSKEKLTFLNFMSQAGLSLFGQRPIDHMVAKQRYRPLTKEERARFVDTQSCLLDISHYGQGPDLCRRHWHINAEAAFEAERNMDFSRN